ncbi:hypothetical protein [Sphingomonas sp. CROZ-RG-20F-R02-07]|uniref:hypothetical protein n=1 Tax=Sphingomonas sp. CROZ-RG-20F-R02-07 TaxID=2914832 RepID=UPI001F599824|nr:hypothetical protein [Sphingomonas sp. CROZ-RG-20F-R02-07]
MARLQPILIVIGVLATLMGLLWIGQGLGYVHWPASSFMLEQRAWADRGAALAVIGLALILAARRIGRR